MLWLAAASHVAAVTHAAPAPAGAVRTQPPRTEAAPDPRRPLSPSAQARLEAVLERFDVIDGGIAWKVRW
jgi:hypothetical protein